MSTIEKSPIYSMSMCSLENFHSCFLNWLGQTYPVETLKIFLPDKNTQNIKFENQVKQNKECVFDLLVTMGNNNNEFLVIENKLKSFPGEEQLTKYSNLFENKKATFILLSLAPEVKLPENWQYLSYKELAKRMHTVFDNTNFTNGYHKYLISDYISVIENLSEEFPQTKSMKYDFYDEKISDDLKDIYIKYKTSELCEYINENTDLSAFVDFRNKQGIVNVLGYKDFVHRITFLIQIQYNEYRYCFMYGDEEDNKIRESIATKLVENDIWFRNCIENYPKARNYESKKFCGYNPNFIYRYQTLENVFGKTKMSDISYQEISEKVNEDIATLIKHKDEIFDIIMDSLG